MGNTIARPAGQNEKPHKVLAGPQGGATDPNPADA